MSWRTELDVALELAVTAGEEALRLYGELPEIPDARADVTTAADHAVQRILIQGLLREFPDDGILAEEETELDLPSPAERPRHWTIDPIDGTRGFARKNDEFAIQVALVIGGEAVVGVVYEPAPGRLTWAARGEGCWARGRGRAEAQRCSVSEAAEGPVVAMSRSRGLDEAAELLEAFGGESRVATYSAGIKLALVARGECDLYLGDYLTLHDWDVVPGHVLVEEAGGRVTNVDGEPISYDGSGQSLAGRGVLATNGRVHDAALAAFATGRVPIS